MSSVSTLPVLSPPRLSWLSVAQEATGFFELPRLAWAARSLRREPRGDGSVVLALPGFGADDRSTWPLRRFLAGQGYDARGWQLGANRAEVPDSIARVGRVVEETVARTGRPLSLVGWSLGGYIAREVARDLPGAVRSVVTFGSPVVGGPKYTTASALAGLRGWDLDEIEAWVEARKQTPLSVPVTAIFSRRDGVVAWRACVDPERGAPIEHVEVDATHLGLGFSADVFRVIARRLARPVPPAPA